MRPELETDIVDVAQLIYNPVWTLLHEHLQGFQQVSQDDDC